MSRLQDVYNFTLLEYKRYLGITYQLYRYISTNEHDIIPLGPQVRLLDHVGRGIERKHVRIPKGSGSEIN